MNDRTKTGLEILQAAVLIGILGDVLLRTMPWGLNIFLFVGTFVAASSMLVLRRKREFWNKQFVALNLALVFFAAMFVWRDAAELKVIDFFAIFTLLAVLILPSLKIKPNIAGVFHGAVGFVWSAINVILAPFFLLFDDIQWKTRPQTGATRHLVPILRGVAIAAPLLLIFGALFMAADAVFEGFVQRTLNIDFNKLLTHVFFISAFSWLTAGYLRGSLIDAFTKKIAEALVDPKPQVSVTEIREDETSKTDDPPKAEEKRKFDWQNFDNSVLPRGFTLGAIETGIILGSTNLLFLSFVIFQLPYLFGGMDFVQNTPDFKLAEYARRGFGELVAVAALVLPILLASHWLLRKDDAVNEKIYRALAGIQIILLFVIMLSAAQRLFLLTGNLGYGMTTTRFYPMVFMIWIALVFVWFALSVLRGARQQFAWGALWLAVFVAGTLHVFNPDEYIVKTNVHLMQEGRMFDSNYVMELSDDAAPTLLEALPSMNFEQQCFIKYKLKQRLEKAITENDFRSWNLSRWNARREISEFADGFDTTGCPSYGRNYHPSDD